MIPMRQSNATSQNSLLVPDEESGGPAATRAAGGPAGAAADMARPRADVAAAMSPGCGGRASATGSARRATSSCSAERRSPTSGFASRSPTPAHDMTPSYWSTVGLIADARTCIGVPLGGWDPSVVPANNAIASTPMSEFDDPDRYPNIAVVRFPGATSSVLDEVDALRTQRTIADLPALVVAWLGFVWGTPDGVNPLLEGHGPPRRGAGRDRVRARRRRADARSGGRGELPRGDLAVGQVVAGLLHPGRRGHGRRRRTDAGHLAVGPLPHPAATGHLSRSGRAIGMTAAAYDAIVIGSGFGGAVTACRLAEAGYRVLVLERGRRWAAADFPREPGDAWRWDDGHPERENGWIDFRIFRSMAVAQGAAVGGGSLIYANISIEATPDTFDAGWPPEITYQELAPHYAAVGRMMNVQPVPRGQWPARTSLMHEAATATGQADRFRPLELAVNFDPGWDPVARRPVRPGPVAALHQCRGHRAGHLRPPRGVRHRLPRPRPQHARPQLPRRAPSDHGAEVRPLHVVRTIEREGDGYRVRSDRIEDGRLVPVTDSARIVVVAAGSLGSTDLLLRCRDVAQTLPRPARHDRPGLEQQRRLPDDRPARRPPDRPDPRADDHERHRLPRRVRGGSSVHHRGRRLPGPRRRLAVAGADPLRLAPARTDRLSRLPAGRPRPCGLRRGHALVRPGPRRRRRPAPASGRWWLFGRRRLSLDWDVAASRPDDRGDHRDARPARQGDRRHPIVPLSWSWLGYLITPHPLGGCNMGTDPDDQRRRPSRRVWGQPNLYVADGAIVPEALGANPSRTIAALAERIASIAIAEGR